MEKTLTEGWEIVPTYGKVRTEHVQVLRNGEPVGPGITFLDLDFQPELPEGALRGNPRACAPFCNHCNVPKYFYLDQKIECIQCGDIFLFSAEEQKHWFEVLKVHIRTEATRCRGCRKARRTRASLNTDLSRAYERMAEEPDNELLCLDLAKTTALFFEETQEGHLDRGVAAARKARAQSERYPESWYWEGRLQQLAGRELKARSCFENFVALAADSDSPEGEAEVARLTENITDARERLSSLSGC